MPSGQHRTYGAHHLHFITSSCYRRLPLLSSACSRDRFLSILAPDGRTRVTLIDPDLSR